MVRRQLVPSKTTLLGLVKHVTFVEGVRFDRAVTAGRTTRSGSLGPLMAHFRLREGDAISTSDGEF